MARDLLQDVSAAEFKREIAQAVTKDPCFLPPGAKIFAAVACLQGFDALPEIVEVKEFDSLIQAGDQELLRGLTSTKGVPARLFARDLMVGPLYPGTLSAVGQGIHFAAPSGTSPIPIFLGPRSLLSITQ